MLATLHQIAGPQNGSLRRGAGPGGGLCASSLPARGRVRFHDSSSAGMATDLRRTRPGHFEPAWALTWSGFATRPAPAP